MIFSIDPGDVRIGFCMFTYSEKNRKADLRIKEILDTEGLYTMLNLIDGMTTPTKKHVFVVENFRVDGQNVAGRNSGHPVMFQWNEMLTSQVIGAVKYAAFRLNQSKVVMQEPRILTMGRKWCDFPVPKNPKTHLKDDVSAYIHGAHFMMKAQMIDSVKDIAKFGQTEIM
jgi:hypothetical protein